MKQMKCERCNAQERLIDVPPFTVCYLGNIPSGTFCLHCYEHLILAVEKMETN